MQQRSEKSVMKSRRLMAREESEEIRKHKTSFNVEKKNVLGSPVPPFLAMANADNFDTLSLESLAPPEHLAHQGSPTIIGICGPASSGKSFIAGNIKDYFILKGIKATMIKERDFLKPIDVENKEDRQRYVNEYDFDHIDAVDWSLFEKAVQQLRSRVPFNSPIFDIFNSRRIIKTKKLEPARLLIIEGRLFLNNEFLRDACNIKVYLDTDLDILLSRIVFKEMAKRTELPRALEKYTKFIKPSYERFIENTKKYADLVIHNFAGTNFDFDQVDHSFEVLTIIKDLLRFRLKDKVPKGQEPEPEYVNGAQEEAVNGHEEPKQGKGEAQEECDHAVSR